MSSSSIPGRELTPDEWSEKRAAVEAADKASADADKALGYIDPFEHPAEPSEAPKPMTKGKIKGPTDQVWRDAVPQRPPAGPIRPPGDYAGPIPLLKREPGGFAVLQPEETAEEKALKFFDSKRGEVLINPSKEIPKPDPILSIASVEPGRGPQPVLTPGNIAVVASQPKSGKTAFVGAAISAVLKESVPKLDGDTLGWVAKQNKEGHAVILIDTEQTEYHATENVKRIMKRVDCDILPQWVVPLKLLGLTLAERLMLLKGALASQAKEHKGIYCVLIDGGADFLASTGDEEQAIAFTDTLHGLALRYKTGILVVIHENPARADANAKTRGHLGSHFERKSESNLRIESKAGVLCVFAERGMRGGHLPKEEGPQFRWCDEAKMHVTVPALERVHIPEPKEKKPVGRPKEPGFTTEDAKKTFKAAAGNGAETPKNKTAAQKLLQDGEWGEKKARSAVAQMGLESIQDLFSRPCVRQ